MDEILVLGIYAVLLALVAGLEVLRRVAPVLTPTLQLLTTALQGVAVVVAMLILGRADSWWLQLLGLLAVVAATAGAVSSVVVANRIVGPWRDPRPPRRAKRDERLPQLPEGQR